MEQPDDLEVARPMMPTVRMPAMTSGVFTKRRIDQMTWPMPLLAATISATMIQVQHHPRVMRRLSTMLGSMDLSTMSRVIWRGFAPRV